MKKIFTRSRRRVLSGLFANLSAGWIGAIIIFPNFTNLSQLNDIWVLILDILAAIVCLFLAFWFEEKK